MTGGGTRVELFQYVEPEGEHRPASGRGTSASPTSPSAATTSTRCCERWSRPAATPFGEVVEVDGGVNAGARAVYVRDPDGHVLELFSPPPPAEAAR